MFLTIMSQVLEDEEEAVYQQEEKEREQEVCRKPMFRTSFLVTSLSAS